VARAEHPTNDSGPYDAEHNVHHKPHLALHELLGEPAGDSANDDGCDPADLVTDIPVALVDVRLWE
jgi:hypothetical protein